MEFEIKRIITNEINNGCLHFDLNDLEQHISLSLSGLGFGNAVVKYFWGFELYKFDGPFAQFFSKDLESWKHSTKWLVTNSRFDWNEISSLDNAGVLNLIKAGMVNSIDRIEKMKRKPRNFDNKEFKVTMMKILDNYKIKNVA